MFARLKACLDRSRRELSTWGPPLRLALGRIDFGILLGGWVAAARYFRTARTAGGGCPHVSRFHLGCFHIGCFRIRRGVGVVGDFFDHVAAVDVEADSANVADGGVECAKDEFGTLEFDGAADQGVDDLHEGGLDGFLVLEEGDVMETRVRAFDVRIMRWWK